MVPSGELKVGARTVGVLGFEGREGYLFVLFDPATRPQGHVSVDSYYPHPDFGYLWFREDGGLWVASGSISVRLVGKDGIEVDRILDFIADELLRLGEQLASRIEVVEVQVTHVESGEENLTYNE